MNQNSDSDNSEAEENSLDSNTAHNNNRVLMKEIVIFRKT